MIQEWSRKQFVSHIVPYIAWMEGITHSTHPFHHCGQKCVENHIVSILHFQFLVWGKRSYFYMLQTWITAHDCTRVVTTMAIVEKCLAQFGQGRSSDLIKSQVEHGCSLHLPDINTANLDGWSSIVEEENIGIWFIGYGWVGSHVDCHAPTLYKSLNHRLIHLQNISQCLGFYIIKIHIFYTW